MRGKSSDLKAGCYQLGWTPGSVRGRLERGRARLYVCLARHGLAAPAILVAAELSRGAGSAAVADWMALMVTAALTFAAGRPMGGADPGRAVAPAAGVARGMALTELQVPAALLLASCLPAAGLKAYRASDAPRRPDQAQTPPPDPAAQDGRAAPAAAWDKAAGPWPEDATRPNRVGGRVLGADGRPVAGMTVRGLRPARLRLL